MRVLAGDIGGTKTLLALAEVDDTSVRVLHEARYKSSEAASLEELVARFVHDHEVRGVRACFGVAGPVIDDVCRVTNLPWVVDARSIAAVFHGTASIINDFAAAACGVACVGPDSVVTLHGGVERPRAPRAILGAGTGLGEAIAYWAGDRYAVLPSEGGHTDLAARDDDEAALLAWLRARHARVSYERVVSGPGLVSVYEHLRERGVHPESAEVRDEMKRSDPAAVIGTRATDGSDALCGRAFDLFAGVYGAEAGNLALQCVALGGVYLAGGIAAKVLPRLVRSPFLSAMHDKGRLSSLVREMPVRVVTEPRLGLLGAAYAATAGTAP